MEMVGENTLLDQKSHYRCRRRKQDCRMVDALKWLNWTTKFYFSFNRGWGLTPPSFVHESLTMWFLERAFIHVMLHTLLLTHLPKQYTKYFSNFGCMIWYSHIGLRPLLNCDVFTCEKQGRTLCLVVWDVQLLISVVQILQNTVENNLNY